MYRINNIGNLDIVERCVDIEEPLHDDVSPRMTMLCHNISHTTLSAV